MIKEGRSDLLTSFDKELLNLLQTNLPLSSHPFADLAEILGTEEVTVLNRLRELQAEGYVRRIGPFFDSAKLGYKGTLVAVKVMEDCMEKVATAINTYPGVTHNYEREGEFNLWFTLLTPNLETQTKILEEIKQFYGVKKIISMAANRKYKISVQFTLK